MCSSLHVISDIPQLYENIYFHDIVSRGDTIDPWQFGSLHCWSGPVFSWLSATPVCQPPHWSFSLYSSQIPLYRAPTWDKTKKKQTEWFICTVNTLHWTPSAYMNSPIQLVVHFRLLSDPIRKERQWTSFWKVKLWIRLCGLHEILWSVWWKMCRWHIYTPSFALHACKHKHKKTLGYCLWGI